MIVTKVTHFNIPQQKAFIIDPNILVAILARATGKDHGIVAPTAIRNAKGLPRGATGFIGPTYVKIKGDMLPSLVKALEKFGLFEEVDFWIGQFIPKSIRHVKPYECPREPQYSMFFRNGHVVRLIGLDRKDSANGQSNDHIILNEARFIKEEDYKSRVVPTNRGNEDIPHFADKHYHHGMIITSDQPTNAEGKWILNFDQFVDQDQIDLIASYDLAYRQHIAEMGDELIGKNAELSRQIRFDKEKLLATMRDLVAKDQLHEALEQRFRKELKRLENILYNLRRECVFTMRASTLDNIDVVTERFIKQMERVLTKKQFRTSILNIEDDTAEEMFYSTFDEDKHCYTDIDYNYMDRFKDYDDIDEPWRKDADLDPSRGLEIGCDFNKKIVSMVVGQEFPYVMKVPKALYVLDPQRIKHLAKAFDDYYKNYPTKKVTHHYDHTATGEDASREESFAQEMHRELSDLGWNVTDHYVGHTAGHDLREKLFRRVFAEDDARTKPVRINRTNSEDMITSVKGCGTRTDGSKDKRSEGRKSVPPQHSVHLTDAFDTLYIGMFQDRLGNSIFEAGFVA